MTEENFLTYPENDSLSRLTLTSTRVTWTDMLGGDDQIYASSDKGANYFDGNFVHLLTFCITASEVDRGAVMPWAMTNDLDDFRGLDVDKDGLVLWYAHSSIGGTSRRLYALEFNDGAPHGNDDFFSLTLNTVYYLKIVRDETVGTYGTFYCYVYSDAARTTLLDTLDTTLTVNNDFRYIMVGASSDETSETTKKVSGYIETLTIEEGEASVLPEVSQQAPTNVMATTLTGNGHINSLGLSVITAHGHCWNTTGNPTTADSKVDNGAGAVGAFTSAITGLTPGTRYYIRAYATNSYGTAYSGQAYSLVSGNPTITDGIAIVQTRFHYMGTDGKEYWLQGTEV